MHVKFLPTLFVGLSVGVVACGGSNGSSDLGTGGAATGGVGTGGTATGGGASGGAPSGGQSSGGAATGGSGGSGGSGGGTGGAQSDARPSQGCGVTDGAETLTEGGASVNGGLPTSTRLTINVNNANRDFIIDIPENYDPAKPHRLVFSWHQAYGSANGNAVGQNPAGNGPNFDAENYAFFGLHREATAAGEPVIFVAPQGIGNFPWDYARDVVLFDQVLARVTEHLCVDESRVFTTGFSFGAMMSHALSIGRASKLRGAVTMAPANYNFTQPDDDPAKIAYFGITGMSDNTCRWVNNDGNRTGGKYCVLTHAEDNGCTIPADFPTAMNGAQDHVCYEFEGCDAGYPVKVCTFDGAHTPTSVSNGMSSADDGLNAFIPPLAWEFLSQL